MSQSNFQQSKISNTYLLFFVSEHLLASFVVSLAEEDPRWNLSHGIEFQVIKSLGLKATVCLVLQKWMVHQDKITLKQLIFLIMIWTNMLETQGSRITASGMSLEKGWFKY